MKETKKIGLMTNNDVYKKIAKYFGLMVEEKYIADDKSPICLTYKTEIQRRRINNFFFDSKLTLQTGSFYSGISPLSLSDAYISDLLFSLTKDNEETKVVIYYNNTKHKRYEVEIVTGFRCENFLLLYRELNFKMCTREKGSYNCFDYHIFNNSESFNKTIKKDNKIYNSKIYKIFELYT